MRSDKKRRWWTTALAALVAALPAVLVPVLDAAPAAAAGSPWLDTTYGSSGSTQLASGDSEIGLVVDGSDRALVLLQTASGYAVARLTSSGALDTGYGSGGYAALPGSADYHGNLNLAAAGDGSVYVGGSVGSSTLAVAKLTASGHADASFGSSGVATFATGGDTDSSMVRVRPGGGVVVAVPNAAGAGHDVLVALTGSGALDTSFNAGSATPGKLDTGRSLWQIAVDTSGRIVAGITKCQGSWDKTCLARYTASGHVDTDFGNAGLAVGPIGVAASGQYPSIAQGSDGLYYVVGSRDVDAGNCANASLGCTAVFLARFTTSGQWDTGYGNGGLALGPATECQPIGSFISPHGNDVWVVGRRVNTACSGTSALIYRFTTGGKIDTTFGDRGLLIDNPPLVSGYSTAEVRGAATQSGGRLLLGDSLGSGGVPAVVGIDVQHQSAGGTTGYVPLTPKRIMDTRTGLGVPRGAVGAGHTVTVRVPDVPAGATAVALNVTTTQPTAATSYVSVCPGGTSVTACKASSNVNAYQGKDIPNLVLVKLGGSDTVTLYNNSGSTHLVADLEGFFVGDFYDAVTPKRAMDTRTGLKVPQGAVGAGHTVTLTVPDLPSGATAVALNVTTTQGTAVTSYVSVCPGGTSVSACKASSNVNAYQGKDIANLVISKLGPGGKVTFYNNAGTMHLVADVEGYFVGSTYNPIPPARAMDTRTGKGGVPRGPVGAGKTVTLTVPGVTASTGAVVLNVTSTEPTATTSYVSVCPGGTSVSACKASSTLNAYRGKDIPNLVIAKLGPGGKVTFYNNAGTTHLVADVEGYLPIFGK